MVWKARDELPDLWEQSRAKEGEWHDEEGLAAVMLGDDPAAIIDGIKEAIAGGATAEALGSTVVYAAFLRMAHFHTSNEFRDWDTVHNTLTAANAVHMALRRAPSVELVRAVFDVAISIYLDRFLNMPPQRIPNTGNGAIDADSLLSQLLERADVRQQVDEVAQLVSQYLTGDGQPDPLLNTLGRLMLREDAGFHSFQLVDAGFKQFGLREGADAGRKVLIGMSRFLAAHSPTPRAVGQTYQIALRLQRGEEIYQEG